MPTATWTALANTTVTGSAKADITFSNIPNTYTDLVLILNSGIDSGTDQDQSLQFNGDTGNNYNVGILWGNGTTQDSNTLFSQPNMIIDFYGSLTTALSTSTIVHIMDYSSTTKQKTAIIRSNRVSSGVDLMINRWTGTAAIHSIRYFANGRNLRIGSTASLYGIVS